MPTEIVNYYITGILQLRLITLFGVLILIQFPYAVLHAQAESIAVAGMENGAKVQLTTYMYSDPLNQLQRPVTQLTLISVPDNILVPAGETVSFASPSARQRLFSRTTRGAVEARICQHHATCYYSARQPTTGSPTWGGFRISEIAYHGRPINLVSVWRKAAHIHLRQFQQPQMRPRP